MLTCPRCPSAPMLTLRRVRRQRRRRWRQATRVLLELSEQVIHTGLELRIVTRLEVCRRVVYGHVGLDTVIFQHPLRIEAVQSVLRNRNVSAVEERPLATDAAHTTPRTRADERPDTIPAEIERKDIAI